MGLCDDCQRAAAQHPLDAGVPAGESPRAEVVPKGPTSNRRENPRAKTSKKNVPVGIGHFYDFATFTS